MRDVLPRKAKPGVAGEQRVEDAIQLPDARRLAREPVQLAAEAHERNAIAPRQVCRGERGGGVHRGVECALVRVLGFGERVEEQDDVGAVLGMLHVYVRDAAARRRAPVDAPYAVAGHERTKIGELDALAALAGDLAAEDRSGSERCDEPVQPADAGVGAKLARSGRARPSSVNAPSRSRARTTAGPASWTPQRPTASSNRTSRYSPRGSQNVIGIGSVCSRAVVGRWSSTRARAPPAWTVTVARTLSPSRARSRSSRSAPSSASGADPASPTATSRTNGVASAASSGRPAASAATSAIGGERRVCLESRRG